MGETLLHRSTLLLLACALARWIAQVYGFCECRRLVPGELAQKNKSRDRHFPATQRRLQESRPFVHATGEPWPAVFSRPLTIYTIIYTHERVSASESGRPLLDHDTESIAACLLWVCVSRLLDWHTIRVDKASDADAGELYSCDSWRVLTAHVTVCVCHTEIKGYTYLLTYLQSNKTPLMDWTDWEWADRCCRDSAKLLRVPNVLQTNSV